MSLLMSSLLRFYLHWSSLTQNDTRQAKNSPEYIYTILFLYRKSGALLDIIRLTLLGKRPLSWRTHFVMDATGATLLWGRFNIASRAETYQSWREEGPTPHPIWLRHTLCLCFDSATHLFNGGEACSNTATSFATDGGIGPPSLWFL